MHTAATFGVAVVQLDEPRQVQPVRGPPPRRSGIHEIVVHRLFSAGLALETALGLMGDHPVAGRIQEALGELDLAIRDYRNALFDHRQS